MRYSRTPLILLLASPLWLAACSPAPAPMAETDAPAPPPMDAGAQPTPPQPPAAEPMSAPPAAADTPAAVDPDAVTDSSDSAIIATPSDETARTRIQRLLGDAAPYEAVFTQLQKAVAADDGATVATLVRYPLRVEVDGKRREISNAAAFEKDYPHIMTPAVKQAILAQAFDDVFVNWQGVMIGQGQVWLTGRCLDAACKRSEVKIGTLQD